MLGRKNTNIVLSEIFKYVYSLTDIVFYLITDRWPPHKWISKFHDKFDHYLLYFICTMQRYNMLYDIILVKIIGYNQTWSISILWLANWTKKVNWLHLFEVVCQTGKSLFVREKYSNYFHIFIFDWLVLRLVTRRNIVHIVNITTTQLPFSRNGRLVKTCFTESM